MAMGWGSHPTRPLWKGDWSRLESNRDRKSQSCGVVPHVGTTRYGQEKDCGIMRTAPFYCSTFHLISAESRRSMAHFRLFSFDTASSYQPTCLSMPSSRVCEQSHLAVQLSRLRFGRK